MYETATLTEMKIEAKNAEFHYKIKSRSGVHYYTINIVWGGLFIYLFFFKGSNA